MTTSDRYEACYTEVIQQWTSMTEGRFIRILKKHFPEPGQPKADAGPKLYKCASKHCPGLPYKASDIAHPFNCGRAKAMADQEDGCNISVGGLMSQQSKADADTVRVRIAVAVTDGGEWAAMGWAGMMDREMRMRATADVEGWPAVSYITADVPLPRAAEVRGDVEEENSDE